MANKYKIPDKEWSLNLWERIKAAIGNVKTLIGGLDDRVTALEEGGGGGGGGGGQVNVIEAVSFNGANVPPDANKRVSMSESDPTVPSWAKQSSKPSYTASEVGALPDDTAFVSGVRGNNEASYRHGDVILTPNDIGALPKGAYYNLNYLARVNNDIDISRQDNGLAYSESKGKVLLRNEDTNGARIMSIGNTIFGDGKILGSLWLQSDAAETHHFGVVVEIDKNGNVECNFTHKAAIREGIDAKAVQTPVSDPTASGEAISFIDAITQDAQGVITSTKKTVPNATTTDPGLMSAADKAKLDGIPVGGGGVTSVNGQTGDVSITPADIGAVDKSGDTMTGPLTIGANIIQTSGFVKGQDGNNTNHALKLGHSGDNVMAFYEYGGQFDFYQSQSNTNTLLFQLKNGVSSKPLPVDNGGTGATEARVLIGGAGYSTILNGINAVRSTRIFPISMQKTSDYCTDAPSGCETNEANIILIGDSDRITAILYIYAVGSGKHIYVRDFFKGNWLDSQWTQIY